MPLGHPEQHRGFDGSGFERVQWGEPIWRDLEFVRAWSEDANDAREHRVESVSDGQCGYRWKCSCGTSGPVVGSFSETDAGALTHAVEAGR